MTQPIVLAVDGGNSKTHLTLVAADGHVLSLVRGPLSSPHHLGVDGCLDVLEHLLAEQFGLEHTTLQVEHEAHERLLDIAPRD